MKSCPCGCGRVVKSGNRYAGHGCYGRKPPRPCKACGKPLRVGARHWHRACVPQSYYVERASQNPKRATFKRRRERFGAELNRIVSERGTLGREDLLDFAQRVFRQGWSLGYHACEMKWRARPAATEAA